MGTILVGDDPGSQAYVRGKHADCAKVGITSIRRDLPADISTATLNETIDELNANPDCTGYIVQLPLPRQADIIVAAVGVPHMVTADMVRPGAAVLDVGVSRVDGRLTGDVHPDVWDVAGHVSPNPGGVGPLTRAFLLTNVVELAERQ